MDFLCFRGGGRSREFGFEKILRILGSRAQDCSRFCGVHPREMHAPSNSKRRHLIPNLHIPP